MVVFCDTAYDPDDYILDPPRGADGMPIRARPDRGAWTCGGSRSSAPGSWGRASRSSCAPRLRGDDLRPRGAPFLRQPLERGKITCGYLYGADPTLETARRLVPGGLAFGRLVSDLIDADIEPHSTQGNDLYLVHGNSVVDAGIPGRRVSQPSMRWPRAPRCKPIR